MKYIENKLKGKNPNVLAQKLTWLWSLNSSLVIVVILKKNSAVPDVPRFTLTLTAL